MEQLNNNPVSPANNQSQTSVPPPVNPAPVNPAPAGQKSSQEASYDMKTLVVVLLLIFLYPIGIILMYVWMKWKSWVKALITAPGCIILIIFFLSFVLGLLATLNPAAQFNKGKCVAECKKQTVNQEQCLQSCFNSFNPEVTPTLTIPAP